MNFIHALQDHGNPNSLAMRFRRARSAKVRQLIETIHAERGACRILDLGGEPGYWSLFDRGFLEAKGVSILLVNPTPQVVDDPMFETLTADACELPQIESGRFDLVHSNSVIEHVGDWRRCEAFAAEVRRLAPRYYIQTPYFYFPIEPHFSEPFFHWRSEQARARLLLRKGRGWFSRKAQDLGEAMRVVQHARLLDKTQFKFLFPDADHVDERVITLTKSLIAIRG
ncbi:class I SAM-dependent methyltransferase [Caulobacter sp. S45]|uniref:class I SAM-dependent methyltransferase n=1 Tax=Caulobacter sp. S45 TaxID=1641861 RepID=UPI00157660B4|nr:class I SAM-dependent methyltransferase [Caulobacter sp. S45]